MTTRLPHVNVRRSLAVAALVLTAPVLSSCGVGFGAQTDQVYNPAAGVDVHSGSVDVLNALIVSGTDGSGTVIATLVNNDQVHATPSAGSPAPARTPPSRSLPAARPRSRPAAC